MFGQTKKSQKDTFFCTLHEPCRLSETTVIMRQTQIYDLNNIIKLRALSENITRADNTVRRSRNGF